ncbi:SDR family oxidoreductase [Streptomyces ardesiacus]|uniref:SDR family oxidoreductase n=1 Tax=Streptomyces ardesiacus TaxID=285564 RepID=UPI003659AC14
MTQPRSSTATCALTEAQLERLVEQIPVGRLAQPQEIADAVYFLAGHGYINGEVLHVDGGAAMGH